MQQPQLIEQFQPQHAAEETTLVQRILGWTVYVTTPPSSNSDCYDAAALELDQRVRLSGEW